jgi:hypothetical protein
MPQRLPRFYARLQQIEDLRRVAAVVAAAEASAEGGEAPATVARATLPGDKRRLRGIPAVGGVCGTVPGTDPLGALLAKERRARR